MEVMINGIKVSMVYHLYCSEKDFEDNVYNEINRRCLEHFHDIFDEVLFCVCVDGLVYFINHLKLLMNLQKVLKLVC